MQEMLIRERNDLVPKGLMMTGKVKGATHLTSICSSMGVLAPLDMVGAIKMLWNRVFQWIGAEIVEIGQDSAPT